MRDDSIGVAVVGAGFMSRGLVRHITQSVPSMRIVAICNRTPRRALDAYVYAGEDRPREVTTSAELQLVIEQRAPAITWDIDVISNAGGVDVIVDATGALEYGAEVALSAIEGGKHVVSLNVELDATLGTILRLTAEGAGLIRSAADGDQPGVQARLAEFAISRGLVPRVLGNVKGLHDVRRNPDTQAEFAQRWRQNVNMVTSFADGTKINFEQALVANAYGFTVGTAAMAGREFDGHVDDLVHLYSAADWTGWPGVVDYVVGARPAPGVYCIAEVADAEQARYLELFKMGTGPLYALYTPYHLCHLEVPTTIASVHARGEGLLIQTAVPSVEVVAVAKTDLRAGMVLDGVGGFNTYGIALPAGTSRERRLLPMGLAEGSILRHDVKRDSVIELASVRKPPNRVIDRLYKQQLALGYLVAQERADDVPST